MNIEVHLVDEKVHVDFSIKLIVDGQEFALTGETTGEAWGLRHKSSQLNFVASAMSLALNRAIRELHSAILPQLRDGAAEALALALPPVDPDGVGSASTVGVATHVAAMPTPHPEAPLGRNGDDSKIEGP